MKNKTLLPIFLAASLSCASISQAIITGGGVTSGVGSFVELTVSPSSPFSVGNNNFQTNKLYGFNESQNITLTSDLSVDLLASTSAAGLLASGTEVASHYIFFDPNNSQSQEGWVSFDADILAIISSTTTLNDSDFLVPSSVTYLTPGLRGLETNDSAIIGSSPNRVAVDWKASTPGDYIRVLTARSPGAAVPDGGLTLGLMGFSLMLLALFRRKFSK